MQQMRIKLNERRAGVPDFLRHRVNILLTGLVPVNGLHQLFRFHRIDAAVIAFFQICRPRLRRDRNHLKHVLKDTGKVLQKRLPAHPLLQEFPQAGERVVLIVAIIIPAARFLFIKEYFA